MQRRAEILDAAKQLFVEEGYAATTIRRIAAKLGISSTALYVYFPDKDAILVEICDATFAGLIVELDEVRRDGTDPWMRWRSLLNNISDLVWTIRTNTSLPL